MLVRAEEHLEVGDKCRGKLLHGDVLHMVADIEELLQVLVNGLVLGKRALGFHACRHLFLVVLVVLIEHCISVWQRCSSPRKAFLTFSAVT